VSEFLHPVKIGNLKEGGSIYQFVRMGKGCLSYFIETDGEAIVVDPARTVDAYIDFAKERNVTIKHVVDTHLHADHILADVYCVSVQEPHTTCRQKMQRKCNIRMNR
jgi:glyoxylase-like metal-dependent hydrolase (beta-lactamase superfamily II)